MIILSQTTDTLQIALAGSVTTNQLRCFSSWRDIDTTTYVAGRKVVNTNNTTDVNLVDAPASSTQRVVDTINIYNDDTVSATVTVKFDDNGTEYKLWVGVLSARERLEYSEGQGWRAFTSQGSLKQTQTLSTPTVNQMNAVTLASDVVNADATANTLYDVTGLSFPVVAGETYWFQFDIPYTSGATTTGSRWTINGASTSFLAYMSEYSLGATTTTRNANLLSYDSPATSNATSSATDSNRAIINGILTASSNGTVIARFASEVSGSAITAKAGALLRYFRTK